MEPAETERRLSVKIHLAMLVALGLYGLVFAQVRARMSGNVTLSEGRVDLFLPMLVLGAVQFVVLSLVARRRLRSSPGPPASRSRVYFLFRAVSAETLALLGLLVGFQGAPVAEVATLFALALAAMLVSFPTREAWENALRAAQTGAP